MQMITIYSNFWRVIENGYSVIKLIIIGAVGLSNPAQNSESRK